MKIYLFICILTISSLQSLESFSRSNSDSRNAKLKVSLGVMFKTKATSNFSEPILTLNSISEFASYTQTAAIYDGDVWIKVSGTVTSTVAGYGYMTAIGPSGYHYERNTSDASLRAFGSFPDDGLDDTQALQKAITYQETTGKRIVVDRSGTYSFTATVTKQQSFKGVNLSATSQYVVFSYSAITGNEPLLKIVGGSGSPSQSILENITFNGNDNTIAIDLRGQNAQRIKNCRFGKNQVGIRFFNEATGSFTEWCTADDCFFSVECQYALHYKKTNGDISFHGCGMRDNCLIQLQEGGSVILVDNGCLPYNSPLSCQVWAIGTNSNPSYLIRNNNSMISPIFVGGGVSVETLGKSVVLATGTVPVFITGSVTTNGDYVSNGKAVICQKATTKSNGTVLFDGAHWNGKFALTTGSNILTVPAAAPTYLATLHIKAANYEYRYVYITQHEGYGGPGKLLSLFNPVAFNGTGYGPPTITLDSNSQIIITNSNFPSSGVTCWLSLAQIGNFVNGNTPNETY